MNRANWRSFLILIGGFWTTFGWSGCAVGLENNESLSAKSTEVESKDCNGTAIVCDASAQGQFYSECYGTGTAGVVGAHSGAENTIEDLCAQIADCLVVHGRTVHHAEFKPGNGEVCAPTDG